MVTSLWICVCVLKNLLEIGTGRREWMLEIAEDGRPVARAEGESEGGDGIEGLERRCAGRQ